MGDEGGFAPNVNDPEEALKLLVAAIEKAGYTGKIFIGSDPAASEWYGDQGGGGGCGGPGIQAGLINSKRG